MSLINSLNPVASTFMPAGGISFMCYENCKKILVDEEEKDGEAGDEDKDKVT